MVREHRRFFLLRHASTRLASVRYTIFPRPDWRRFATQCRPDWRRFATEWCSFLEPKEKNKQGSKLARIVVQLCLLGLLLSEAYFLLGPGELPWKE